MSHARKKKQKLRPAFTPSPAQKRAIEAVKKGRSIFLTGPGGVGKTETVKEIIHRVRSQGRRVAVCASTGIAAVHIRGTTIHSFLGTKLCKNVNELMKMRDVLGSDAAIARAHETDLIVLDEVSMLTGDYLDMMDYRLRILRGNPAPFGGLQILFCGDLLQLPPVIKGYDKVEYRYPYQSEAWRSLAPESVLLTKIFRQSDAEFIQHLLNVRCGRIGSETVDYFNQRVGAELDEPTELHSRNDMVDRINSHNLFDLPGKKHTYNAELTGSPYHKNRLVKNCIVPVKLELKEGAPVLFCRNAAGVNGMFYTNGERGIVAKLNRDCVLVRKQGGQHVLVAPERWELLDAGMKPAATLTQIPLKLAWALTIHKSQGMSLDLLRCDVSECFAEGQTYVALSRARRFDGLALTEPMRKDCVQTDNALVEYYESMEEVHATEADD